MDRESRRKDKLAFLSEEEETANARAMNWEDLGVEVSAAEHGDMNMVESQD